MNVDLTKREIELLLILIEEATKGKYSFGSGSIVTGEEERIIEKLKESQMSADDTRGGGSP